jgi:signal transduction histidine kinase
VLYGVETAIAEEVIGDFEDLTPAQTVQIARRLQQGASRISLAASKGYTQAVSSRMRANFRHLRHDLRNPLGTIKSVLALMDDETIPTDERVNPRFRAMARRNARLLGELIADRLSDSEVVSPLLAYQNVSLRTVACAIRRDLRAEAAARSITILVAGTKTRVRVDAIGLELMLHELLHVVLQEASEGDEIRIDFGEGTTGDRAIVRIHCMPVHPLIANHASLERLTVLAAQLGAKLETKDCLILSLPVQHLESGTTLNVLKHSDIGELHHDVRSTHQRENGQSSSF